MDSSSTETTLEVSEYNTKGIIETKETLDPDYLPAFAEKSSSQASLSLHQQDAKEHTVKKIKNIVRNQFSLEMRLKEQEIESIDENIRQTKIALDRIRACVLARYYGMSEGYSSNTTTSSLWSKPRRSRRDREGASKLQSIRSLANDNKPSRSSLLSSSSQSATSLKNVSQLNNQFSSQQEDKRCEVVNSLKTSPSLTYVSSTTSEMQNSSSSMLCNTADNSQKISQCNHSKNMKSTESSNKLFKSDQQESFALCLNSESSIILQGCSDKDQMTKSVTTERHISESSETGSQSSSSGSLVNHLKALSSFKDDKVIGLQSTTLPNLQFHYTDREMQITKLNSSSLSSGNTINTNSNSLQTETCGSGSRFYVMKRVIIGNTSKYIPQDRCEENDKSTHKWMVYVRGPPEDPNIDTYVKKVWFFLHPSYRPNDIVEINKPPFQLTRRGWGEFPIRVQLHFVGSWNKRVDIIHELKLDKTYTGLQTLGAETVVDLEIDRKTFEDLGIPVPLESQTVHDQILMDKNRTASTSNLTQPEAFELMRKFSDNLSIDKVKDLETPNNFHVKKIKLEASSSSTLSSQSDRCLMSSKDFLSDSGLQEQLHILSENIPLISPQKDINFTFRAASVSQFFEWNVGKQRASEWQRALKIRNEVRKTCSSSTITTKEVMIWCRLHGYTPQSSLVTEPEVCYCKVCGRQLVNDEVVDSSRVNLCPGKQCFDLITTSSTLSSGLELLQRMEAKEKLVHIKHNDDEDVEVDIVNLPRFESMKNSTSDQRTRILATNLTLQQQWVKDVCNEIGVGLRPQVIEGVEVNSVETTLFEASREFVKQLVHRAVALSNDTKSSLDSKLLVPRHINEAIKHLTNFDFLSNVYFGIDDKHQSE